MSRSILILLAHPLPDSLCAALARTYADNARRAGHQVTLGHRPAAPDGAAVLWQRPVRVARLGPVRSSSPARRQRWLQAIARLGAAGH